jgi:hypothetical protein
LPASDQIFYEAYHNCQIINKLLYTYTAFVAIVAPLYIFFEEFSRLTVYLGFLAVISAFRFYYYFKISKLLKNIRVYYLLA